MDMSDMEDAMSGAADLTDEKRGREKLMRALMMQQGMGANNGSAAGAGISALAPLLMGAMGGGGPMQGMLGHGGFQSRDPFGGLLAARPRQRGAVLDAGGNEGLMGLMGGLS